MSDSRQERAGRLGTRVTCEDLSTGESESREIVNDYVVVVDGLMEVAAIQRYANGTTQITLKKAPVSPALKGETR